MCIFARIGFDPGGSATGATMLDLHFTPPPPLPTPPLSTPIFPSLFSVEQTETELPLLVAARACLFAALWRDHVRICVAE